MTQKTSPASASRQEFKNGYEDVTIFLKECANYIHSAELQSKFFLPQTLDRAGSELIRIYLLAGIEYIALTWQTEMHNDQQSKYCPITLFEKVLAQSDDNILRGLNLNMAGKPTLGSLIDETPIPNLNKACEYYWGAMKQDMQKIMRRYDGTNLDLLRMGIYGGLFPDPLCYDAELLKQQKNNASKLKPVGKSVRLGYVFSSQKPL